MVAPRGVITGPDHSTVRRVGARKVVRMGFSQVVRARGEAGLVVLLRHRPDLATPPPTSVRALAARATSRASLDRALAGVDAQVLQVLEAVVALAPTAAPGPPSLAQVRHAVGAADDDARRAVGHALDLALLVPAEPVALWPDDAARAADHPALADLVLVPCPGLDEALGPYPAGLGPPLVRALDRRSRGALDDLAARLGADPAPADDAPTDAPTDADVRAAVAARLADPDVVDRLLAEAPPGARHVLEALRWGPPVGRTPERPAADGAPSPARAAVDHLLGDGLLAVSDAQHVVLPREVALALRGGRTHAEPATRPVPAPPPGPVAPPATVDAESAAHAEEAVRLVAEVVAAWGAEPVGLLRSGGLGVRELRRLAARLEVPEADAALLVETAAAAGLVAADGEETPSALPTTDADDWLDLDLGHRWEQLARAWLTSDRAAWLVGTRDDRGTVRAALDAEALRRPWAPRLRRAVLDVLGEAGTPLAAADVHAVLRWRTPRSAPAEHAVEAVLREAAVLGVVGAGALGSPGRALLTPDDGAAATALAAALPAPVDDLLLQGDLTGVVPGRPGTELAALLERAAVVESRGGATTVRFTATSVQRALDAGTTADELLAQLSAVARGGVPQPLEYLVRDVARRHGQVRTGLASAYLRSDDPTLLAGLAEDAALRHLGLLRVAPTVLVAQVPPAALLAALRDRGVPVVAEDTGGHVLALHVQAQRIRTSRRWTRPAETADGARERRHHRVARDVLASRVSDDLVPDRGAPDPVDGPSAGRGTPDPVVALALLREAAAEGREVWLELVDPAGAPVRRRVRPLRVDGGRVRVVDPAREAELTVAVHRITDVTPA